MCFKDEDEAIRLASNTPCGLAATVPSKAKGRAERVTAAEWRPEAVPEAIGKERQGNARGQAVEPRSPPFNPIGLFIR